MCLHLLHKIVMVEERLATPPASLPTPRLRCNSPEKGYQTFISKPHGPQSMYSEEWEPVMRADSIEQKVGSFAELAQKRANERDKPVEEVVQKLTQEEYMMKHTTSDVLSELIELEEAYPEEFYNGDANRHLMQYMSDDLNFEFWYDYLYLALGAGLEWAVLNELEEPVAV